MTATAERPAATAKKASTPDQPDPEERNAFAVLIGYAKPHRVVLFGTLLLVLAASGSGLVQPLVARDVLSALGTRQSVFGPICCWPCSSSPVPRSPACNRGGSKGLPSVSCARSGATSSGG